MGLSSKHVDEDVLNGTQMERLEIPKVSNMPKAPPLKCPRCSSTGTKFCYYNNYSLTQPRHFCRTCRRHWTAGGSLRNIPSSECRKNKRRKTTAIVITTSAEASDFPAITSPAVVENSVCSANLLTKSSRPLEFEFGTLSSGFSFYSNSTSRFPFSGYSFEELKEGLIMNESKATASGSAEESLVFPASFLDFWDGGADFTARGFLGI